MSTPEGGDEQQATLHVTGTVQVSKRPGAQPNVQQHQEPTHHEQRMFVAQVILASMAVGAFAIGIWNLWLTRQTFRTAHRAWVLITYCHIPLLQGRRECTVKNWGSGPAIHVQFGAMPLAQSVARPEPKPPKPSAGVIGIPSTALLGPGQDAPMGVDGMDDIDDATKRRIQTGEIYLFVVGVITYQDIFRKARHTTFCLRYDPSTEPGTYVACENGNEAY